MQKTSKFALLSVMLCFFAMGFVDLVGIASNYVKEDLGLNDKTANIFPSLVFFWFLIFSVPTGMLMNKIGRKKTVLLSLIVTVVSLFIPLLGESFGLMLVAFSLLGIGNALMQTSLNPLVSTVLKGGNLASTLTFGQFIKAIASFLAPYLAMWGATQVIPSMGYDWKVLFVIYFIVGILATRLRHLFIFHLPYHRLSDRLVLPAHHEQPPVLHHQRMYDGALHAAALRRCREVGTLCSYCPCWLRQL